MGFILPNCILLKKKSFKNKYSTHRKINANFCKSVYKKNKYFSTTFTYRSFKICWKEDYFIVKHYISTYLVILYYKEKVKI